MAIMTTLARQIAYERSLDRPVPADHYRMAAEHWGNRVRLAIEAHDWQRAYDLAIVAGSCAEAYLAAYRDDLEVS